MELIYGTYNPSKVEHMKGLLSGIDIEIVGLRALGVELTEAEESGMEPLRNAVQKAKSYYQQLKRPVFSCDSGLYFEGVKEADQPGAYIKRVKGRVLSSKEMLDYYSNLAHNYGGKLLAYYQNAICLMMDDEHVFKYAGEDLYSDKFYLVDRPHSKYREGFPLDSISVQISSGKYFYDVDEMKYRVDDESGFKKFFMRNLTLEQVNKQ